MTKLMVALRNFANADKNQRNNSHTVVQKSLDSPRFTPLWEDKGVLFLPNTRGGTECGVTVGTAISILS
jgi:hypothetical protein